MTHENFFCGFLLLLFLMCNYLITGRQIKGKEKIMISLSLLPQIYAWAP